MFKLLNDGYVYLRVLIYDLKPAFYIRLYTYAFELCLREQFILCLLQEKSSFFSDLKNLHATLELS